MRSSVGGPPVDVNRADGSHADGNAGKNAGKSVDKSVGKNARGMALPRLLTAALCALAAAGCVPTLPESAHADALAQGIVWQLDNEHLNPHGDWNRLGVSELRARLCRRRACPTGCGLRMSHGRAM
jgi:hypothetical protein